MGIESRRQARRTVPGMMEVYDTITEEPVGYLGNVSVGGMLLIANRALVDDALYQFRFALPDDVGETQPLEVGAHVLWVDDASAPGQSLRAIASRTCHSCRRSSQAAAGTAARRWALSGR